MKKKCKKAKNNKLNLTDVKIIKRYNKEKKGRETVLVIKKSKSIKKVL